MNPQLVIGPILVVVGIIVSLFGWSVRNAPPAPRGPKAGDFRIVEKLSGEFAVERYYEDPDWHEWIRFPDVERAKAHVEKITTPEKVISTITR